jgi:hypothetical protein
MLQRLKGDIIGSHQKLQILCHQEAGFYLKISICIEFGSTLSFHLHSFQNIFSLEVSVAFTARQKENSRARDMTTDLCL